MILSLILNISCSIEKNDLNIYKLCGKICELFDILNLYLYRLSIGYLALNFRIFIYYKPDR